MFFLFHLACSLWPGPVLLPLRWRQGDQAVLVHGENGHPSHYVLESAIGLEPADAAAKLFRERTAVQGCRRGDQLLGAV